MGLFTSFSDLLSHGPVQQLDLSDSDESLGQEDDSSTSEVLEDDDDEDAPVTAKNMEARSKALDRKAIEEAEMDDEDARMDDRAADDDEDVAIFDLPTAEEKEKEQKIGGIPLQELQKRLQDCVRVLNDFKKLASRGR